MHKNLKPFDVYRIIYEKCEDHAGIELIEGYQASLEHLTTHALSVLKESVSPLLQTEIRARVNNVIVPLGSILNRIGTNLGTNDVISYYMHNVAILELEISYAHRELDVFVSSPIGWVQDSVAEVPTNINLVAIN